MDFEQDEANVDELDSESSNDWDDRAKSRNKSKGKGTGKGKWEDALDRKILKAHRPVSYPANIDFCESDEVEKGWYG